MTVRRVRLGGVVELRREAVPINADLSYRPVGVRGFGRGIFEYPALNGADLGKLRFFRLEPDRLVVSSIKGWEGAVAVTGESEEGRIVSNRFLTYAADQASVDLRFVVHWLLSDDGLGALGRASPGSADRNRRLAIKDFEKIEMPLPDLAEQRRIAAHLDRVAEASSGAAASAAAGRTRVSPALLPRVITSLFDSAELPRVKVGDLVNSVSDTIHPGADSCGAREFVGLEHVESHTGRGLGRCPVGAETGRKFRFVEGDLTYGYLRPYLNKVWLADRVGLCSVEQFVLRPEADVEARVLGHALRSASVLQPAIEATNRLQLPRLRLATLLDLEVPDVRQATTALAQRLEDVRDLFVRLETLRARRKKLVEGSLPAARNEIFTAMR